jgi:hypothetical protein
VFNVIAPFLTQLKNRLGNIRLELDVPTLKLKFYNSENVPTSIDLHPPKSHGVLTLYPRFARKSIYASGSEGYIVIMLPEGVTYNVMMTVFVDVFIYKTGKAFSCALSGYNYESNHWYNVTAREITKVPNDLDKVRFARFLKSGGDANNNDDYTRFGFIIGDNQDAKIPYLKVSISKLLLSHQVTTDATVWDNDNWLIDSFDDSDIPPHKVDYTKVM